jgi:hypothetical protein
MLCHTLYSLLTELIFREIKTIVKGGNTVNRENLHTWNIKDVYSSLAPTM